MKVVHKYKWKFARKHLHSLTIETEIGPWSRLLLLQLARNVASLFDPDSKYFSTSSKYFSARHQLFCYFQYIGKKSVGYHPLFLTGQKAILEMLMLNNKRNSDGVKLSILTLVLGGRPPCSRQDRYKNSAYSTFRVLPICLGIANPLTGGQNEKLLRLLFQRQSETLILGES